MNLQQKINEAIWICHTLFQQGKVTGSTSNLSFKHEEKVYITGTNVCFGRITKDDFSIIQLDGQVLSEKKPSKEYPLHLLMYQQHQDCQAVIHTHSLYATLYSMIADTQLQNLVPKYTPYLSMKLGDIGWVQYEQPGSQALFSAFEKQLDNRKGYLLANHGPIVCGNNLMNTYYAIEELEESCKIAFLLKDLTVGEL